MGIFTGLLILGFLFFLTLLGMLFWAIHSGQYDDLSSPPEKILWEDLKDE